MRLESAPKVGAGGVHRTVAPRETLRRVAPAADRVGITRVADLTGLDRIGVPTFGAVMPDTPDPLSVYNGKGLRPIDARVGALMEAIERWTAIHLEAPLRCAAWRERESSEAAMDPRNLVLGMHEGWTVDSRYASVGGWDLARDRRVDVPAQAAAILFDDRFGEPCYRYSTTNGLASGNRIEEAVCHALCELIERDAWTLAELRARHLPEMLRRHGRSVPGVGNGAEGDDAGAWPDIDLEGSPPPVARLARRFRDAGVELRVKDITSDIGIATVFVTLVEEAGIGEPLAHFGLGTHPDARVALVRALTEVAQCRVVDIHAVREDLGGSGESDRPFPAHTRRVERVRRESWYHRASQERVSWRDLPHYEHADVLDDVRLLLRRLQAIGLGSAVAVDLTHPELGLPVVRLLVPGLESWAADHGRLGARAEAAWRRWQVDLRGATP